MYGVVHRSAPGRQTAAGPGPVVAEVGYLLSRLGGARVEAAFLRSLADGSLRPVDPMVDDYARMADLVGTYADFPLGTTDACVIALSERLGINEVSTLDHRHFQAVRPRQVAALQLLP
jgi:uncharacterized protein